MARGVSSLRVVPLPLSPAKIRRRSSAWASFTPPRAINTKKIRGCRLRLCRASCRYSFTGQWGWDPDRRVWVATGAPLPPRAMRTQRTPRLGSSMRPGSVSRHTVRWADRRGGTHAAGATVETAGRDLENRRLTVRQIACRAGWRAARPGSHLSSGSSPTDSPAAGFGRTFARAGLRQPWAECFPLTSCFPPLFGFSRALAKNRPCGMLRAIAL